MEWIHIPGDLEMTIYSQDNVINILLKMIQIFDLLPPAPSTILRTGGKNHL